MTPAEAQLRNEVTFTFIDHDRNVERVLETDPKGWDNSDRRLKRSEKYFGAFSEWSKNLEFVEKERDFLKASYQNRKSLANVSLLEERQHPTQDGLYSHSIGKLDFREFLRTQTGAKLPFYSGGLNALVAAQQKEKFDLSRLTSINNKPIEAFDPVTVALTSRSIFLLSELNNANNTSNWFSQLGPPRVPNLNVISNGDPDNIGITTGVDAFLYDDTPPEHFFFLKSDVDKTITFKLNYDIHVSGGGFGTVNFQPFLRRFSYNPDTEEYTDEETYILHNAAGDYLADRDYAKNIEIDIDLNENDSLVLAFSSVGGDSATTSNSQQLRYDMLEVEVTEESSRPDSQAQAHFFHEIGESLMRIITGESGRFVSKFYGRTDVNYSPLNYDSDGDYSRTALTTGFWIRQFYEKAFEISLEDFVQTANMLHNVGYSIETINGKECLVMEDMRYFFQSKSAIKLPNQVHNLERLSAKEYAYQSIKIGFKEGGEYEAVNGLEEYNTRSSWTSPLINSEIEYEKESPARGDAIAKELARRKLKLNFPKEDTPYDRDLHILDLKIDSEGGTAFKERVWQDDYEVAPTGVFSPDTATNLRITPLRCRERHEWFFVAGMQDFSNDLLNFASNDGNELLTTKKVDEPVRQENASYEIEQLQRALFRNEWLTFEHPVDYDISQALNGKTEVNGRLIPNVFFKIEFTDDEGRQAFGYMFDINPNDNGKFKLLEAV